MTNKGNGRLAGGGIVVLSWPKKKNLFFVSNGYGMLWVKCLGWNQNLPPRGHNNK